MASFTYPSGVSDWVTLTSATNLTNTAAEIGKLSTGGTSATGAAWGEQNAPQVVLNVAYVKNSSDTLVVTVQVSNDDVTYFTDASLGWSSTMTTADSFRMSFRPFSRGVKYVKVLVNTGTVGGTAGTVTINARLSGIRKPVQIN